MPAYRLMAPASDRKVGMKPRQKMLNTNNASMGIRIESMPCRKYGLVPPIRIRRICKTVTKARLAKLITYQNRLL